MMDLYEFEYRFMPYLINECSQRKLHPLALTDKGFIRETVEKNCKNVPWNWDDFQINVYDIEGNPVIIYKFPEPDMPPLARFAAAIADKHGLKYYTFEYSIYEGQVVWYFCMQKIDGHTNLGMVDECVTPDDFARFIKEKVFKIKSKSSEKKSWLARILSFFKK